jgi:phenylacetate-CoA ligase
MVDRIQRYQLNRLKRLVSYAYQNVPLYRRKYDAAGVKPGDIRTLEDFQRLPLLTKSELQAGFPSEILSRRVNPDHCYIVSTSGQSGSPVKLYRRKIELSILPALYLLAYPWIPSLVRFLTGVNAGRKTTLILPEDESYDLYRAVKSLSGIPLRLRNKYQYIATEADPADQLKAISEHRPDVIASDLTALRNMVTFAQNKGLPIPPAKLLFIGSELIDSHARAQLNEAFGARIIEHYGSEEAGTIAFECRQGEGLHLVWRTNYLELLADERPAPAGTTGEVVVTNLMNRATPIIRYSGMGDLATISPALCKCGRKSPLLKMIDGRKVDTFILPDGRIIHPFNLTVPMEHIPNVWRYQIRQEQTALIRVLVTINNHCEAPAIEDLAEMRRRIRSGLHEILGEEVLIEVDVVDDIPAPSGARAKAKPVISLVERPV